MINIVCVKYGTKYDHTYPNRLYQMVKYNCSFPFIFYCMTDNTDYLNPYIETININKSYDLDSYWWKLTIFDNIYAFDAPTIFFDLDVILQNNIDYFFTELYDPEKITIPFIGAYPRELDAYPDSPTEVNSSIMIFKPSKMISVKEDFLDDVDFNIIKYRGVCRYLWANHQDKFKFLDWGKDYYMCFKRPVVADKEWLHKHKVKGFGYHMPEVTVALLNGMESDRHRKIAMEYFENLYK